MKENIEIKWVTNEGDDNAEVTIKKWKDRYPNNIVTGKYIDKKNTEIQIHLDESAPQASKPEAHFFNAFLRNCPV